jgi:peptide subunit release factor 1 (eRF1)
METPVFQMNFAREIERFDPSGHEALTLYLNSNPSRESGSNLRAQLQDVMRPIRSALAGEEGAGRLEAALEAGVAAIAELKRTPRALAIFSCPPRRFTRAVPLPEPVAECAHWGRELYLKPLLAALDEHELTLVALVDREKARLFQVFLGEIEEVADIVGGSRKHAEAGGAQRRFTGGIAGWSIRIGYGESKIQRHDELLLRRHLEDVVDAIQHVNQSAPADRILLGGIPETVSELRLLLPKRLRSRARVALHTPVDAPEARVLADVLEAQGAFERASENELVEALMERDAAHACFGVAAVSEAVFDGRVHKLVYSSSADPSGAECVSCGWLTPGAASGACPRCGGGLQERPDLIDRLASRVLHAGGRVEAVSGPAAERLATSEGVAALLRHSAVRIQVPA